MGSVPSRADYLNRWTQLHGGLDPRQGRLVHGWLSGVYFCARPLAKARLAPDVITLFSLLVSGVAVWLSALGGTWVLAASAVVVVSGLLDNIDGAVAVLTDRVTAWGAVLDSVVDRCCDVFYLVALWVVGAPAGVCVAGGVAMFVLEFARARAAAGGMHEIGVVTIAERPTRVIVTAAFLLGAGLYVDSAAQWAQAGAWVWLAVSVVAVAQLLVVIHRRLREPNPG